MLTAIWRFDHLGPEATGIDCINSLATAQIDSNQVLPGGHARVSGEHPGSKPSGKRQRAGSGPGGLDCLPEKYPQPHHRPLSELRQAGSEFLPDPCAPKFRGQTDICQPTTVGPIFCHFTEPYPCEPSTVSRLLAIRTP